MKVLVCKGCGHRKMTDNKCPICFGTSKDSGIFEEVNIEKEPTCCYCKKKLSETEWKTDPPFYNVNNNTFYCGCRGWE